MCQWVPAVSFSKEKREQIFSYTWTLFCQLLGTECTSTVLVGHLLVYSQPKISSYFIYRQMPLWLCVKICNQGCAPGLKASEFRMWTASANTTGYQTPPFLSQENINIPNLNVNVLHYANRCQEPAFIKNSYTQQKKKDTWNTFNKHP